ncbi:PIG-L deacetylase family protein [Ruania halotolerans]|uniref:PIG-L deacetylase family protein n=1 Tax=Ruania halotolerans TaxID=2897773 RepID=UPI001E578D3A|nr:PIG-L deacetylase family protein [Ruania halotolerans]UFU06789.1 PIG-L family deacetylase [Ruania halotolerans]
MHHVLTLILSIVLLSVVLTQGDWIARHVRHAPAVRAAAVTIVAVLVPANAQALWFAPGSPFAVGVAVASVALLIGYAGAVVLLRFATAPVKAPRRILAIGAHPDDLELACGGALAKFVDAGHDVHVLVMSQGSVGGDEGERILEARRGATFLGAQSVVVHDFPDTMLQEVTQGLVMAMEAAIEEIAPDVILTHSAHDQHQDHAAVHAATLRAARQHSTILCYESPSVTRDFNPSVFIDIADYVDIKVQAVRMHRNQSGKPYMSAQRLRGMATFRGSQAKREFAEAYEPVRLLGSAVGDL